MNTAKRKVVKNSDGLSDKKEMALELVMSGKTMTRGELEISMISAAIGEAARELMGVTEKDYKR